MVGANRVDRQPRCIKNASGSSLVSFILSRIDRASNPAPTGELVVFFLGWVGFGFAWVFLIGASTSRDESRCIFCLQGFHPV